jgi:cell division protein FtsI (penicillin-binding protein 3)
MYEPGSTFKIVTASAALNEHVLTPSDMVDTNPGASNSLVRVHQGSSGHNYGVVSFEEAIVRSSNVGAVKIGQQRRRRSHDSLRRSLRVRAENRRGPERRICRHADTTRQVNESALASMSMGYQVGVTACKWPAPPRSSPTVAC